MLAGKVFGIPVRGTHAHSWVMSFDDELEAFRAYAACYPDPILLVDTYDTLTSGLPNAVTVFKELRAAGRPVRAAIRLDSGDLARLSKAAYRMFTEAGFDDPLIVASNELDEDLIADLKRQGAPINSWGVGTHLITSSDHPALGGVYKLVAVRRRRRRLGAAHQAVVQPGQDDRPGPQAGGPLLRRRGPAPGRHHPPGRRGARRHRPGPACQAGAFRRAPRPLVPAGRLGRHPLRRPAAARDARRRAGERTGLLEEIRARARAQVAALPEELRRLRNPEIYAVGLSPRLAAEKVRWSGRLRGFCGRPSRDLSTAGRAPAARAAGSSLAVSLPAGSPPPGWRWPGPSR